MFICAVTKRPSKPREKLTRLPVEFRTKRYVNIVDGEEIISYGQEIVKEINVSTEGLEQLKLLKQQLEGDPNV